MIERFLCQFYEKYNTELNDARYQMFRGKRQSPDFDFTFFVLVYIKWLIVSIAQTNKFLKIGIGAIIKTQKCYY